MTASPGKPIRGAAQEEEFLHHLHVRVGFDAV
jgi:hypothetical protein